MSMTKSARRHGAACPMILGVLGFLLGLAALVIAVCRDPMMPGFSLRNPFGDPLGSYDFNTASGAYKSEMQARMNRDFKAMMEYENRLDRKRMEEKISSMKVDEEIDYKREAEKGAKKSKGTGEYKVLLISYKDDGEDMKEVASFEKDPSGLWKHAYLDSYEIRNKNKDLAAKMDKYSGRPSFPDVGKE